MAIPCLFRTSTALALCLLLAVTAFPQIGNLGNLGNIGPSKGEIITIIAGVADAITAVGFFVYHETHKHPSITGCAAFGADGLTLQNEKDKRVYALSGDCAALKAGERVTVRGKKVQDFAGPSFQVDRLTKDFGSCNP